MPQSEKSPHTRPGLKSSDIDALRAQYGWNELPAPKTVSPITVFARQFTSFLVLILLAAAGIAYYLGEVVDTVAILLVVGLNGILGFVQEWRAETALDALRSIMSPSAIVIRDGQEQVLPAREVLPGDLVIVEAGDRVPADMILSNTVQLKVDESVLTGESVPVDKSVDDDVSAGTSVAFGRAEGRVTAIGPQTTFGQIANLTGSVGEKTTQLQHQLGRLGRQLGLVALLIAVSIISVGLAVGRDLLEMFMTGLSLAVAMVPEGLPAVVTITLALGASAMVRKNALARRLQAVETLGAATVICTDKTGTLTENKMTVTQLFTADRAYDVTGTGYDPAGHIENEGKKVRAADDPDLALLLEAASTCNHASLRNHGGQWSMVGEPTEGALVTLAHKGWASPPSAAVLSEIPFSSERKRMSVLVRQGNATTSFAKGAPEQMLELSNSVLRSGKAVLLTDDMRSMIEQAYSDMASRGLRVIALAYKSDPGQDPETDMTFIGLAGMIDPPRPEVANALKEAQSAGINVIMITGDSPVTARAIAHQLGLSDGRSISGAQIDQMDDDALAEVLKSPVLFARATPAHKMRIVRLLQNADHIVAMTGDGVNDAPALKQADIGVAMGIRGTDVAKDAADLVLLDDNFATIVGAIREGRRQFDNVKKFVRYLLSSNTGEVIAILVNILIGGPLVFLATQILWMNLVTDGVTAVALGLEKSEAAQMKRPPRPKGEPIIGRGGLFLVLAFGLYTGASSLAIFYYTLPMGEDLARTTAFTAMVVFEKISVFAFRSLKQPCTAIGWFSNRLLWVALVVTLSVQVAAVYWPPLQLLLHTTAIGLDQWYVIAATALPLLIVPEILKFRNVSLG